MEEMEDSNLLESVLSAYNQRLQQTALTDEVNCENDETSCSAVEPNSDDITNSLPSKRKAPVKPKRKVSAGSRHTNNILRDLDVGEPVDVQEIMDSITARNEGLLAGNPIPNGGRSCDSPVPDKATETSSHALSKELDAERSRLITSDVIASNESADDQHIYSDVDHTWAVDLIPPSLPERPYAARNHSLCSLNRGNCSMEDITAIGENDDESIELGRPGRLKTSTSFQSDLNYAGIESSSPSKKLGRFGSRRKRSKKPGEKDFGQFLDAAATNASSMRTSAYAKLKQLKKKAKENIKDNIPGRYEISSYAVLLITCRKLQ